MPASSNEPSATMTQVSTNEDLELFRANEDGLARGTEDGQVVALEVYVSSPP